MVDQATGGFEEDLMNIGSSFPSSAESFEAVEPGELRALRPSGEVGERSQRAAGTRRSVVDVVRAEAAERLEAAAQLTAPAHADRAAQLRAEAAVLLRFLDGPGTA